MVFVFCKSRKRQRFSQHFESLAVGAKSETACQNNVKRFFPMLIVPVQQLLNGIHFLLQPFGQQGSFPALNKNSRNVSYFIRTRNPFLSR